MELFKALYAYICIGNCVPWVMINDVMVPMVGNPGLRFISSVYASVRVCCLS